MQKTSLKIDNQEIDLKQHFTTLHQESNTEFTTKVKINGYENLGYMINSLIGVCQTALHTFNENSELSEYEKQTKFGATSHSIIDVLEFAKNLLPMPEFHLLDKINQSIK